MDPSDADRALKESISMEPQVPPPEAPDSPITDAVLRAELSLAREHGLDDPDHPLPNLLAVARILSAKPTDAEQIEDAITQAIGILGGDDAKALLALMGFTDDTRGLRVRPRREKAAELIGHITYEGFRTRHERALLRSVASHLSGLVRERRMADRITSAETASARIEVFTPSPTSANADASTTPQADQQAAPDGRRSPKPWRLLALGACLVIGAALLVAVLSPGNSIPRHCGSTGLQFVNTVSQDAEKPSNLFVYAPHQYSNEEGWASYTLSWKDVAQENFHAGETRLLALTYHNELNEYVAGLLARVGLSNSAALQPHSVCVYQEPDPAHSHLGTALPGKALAQTGLRLPTLPPYSAVYLTFEVKLPASLSQHKVEIYGAINHPSAIAGLDWYSATAANGLTLPLTK